MRTLKAQELWERRNFEKRAQGAGLSSEVESGLMRIVADFLDGYTKKLLQEGKKGEEETKWKEYSRMESLSRFLQKKTDRQDVRSVLFSERH